MTDWHPSMPDEYRNAIVTGDARVLAERIPDESVDLVFSDPVYDRIDDYRWLAETAARVLKPDSACLVYGGIGYLPEMLQALCRGEITFRWQFVQFMPRKNQRGAFRTFSNYKVLLWLERGTRHPSRHIRDLIVDGTNQYLPQGNSARHDWAKSPDTLAYWLTAFSENGDTVYDPFVGGGSLAATCKMLGRNYIASEIDPDTAERARQRVLMTQPPLFVMQEEQGELWTA